MNRNSELGVGEANVDHDFFSFFLRVLQWNVVHQWISGHSPICIQLLLLTHNGKFRSMLPAINDQLPKLHFRCVLSLHFILELLDEVF